MKTFFLSVSAALLFTACSKSQGSQNNQNEPDQSQGQTTPIPYANLPQTQSTHNVGAQELYVNVMGNTAPQLPQFATVNKKKGLLRGYVKNVWGQPVSGAYIGVRSSLVGGGYTMASATTDEKGYYQIEPPYGALHFFAAGHVLNYGDGQAVQGLYPADGLASPFASADGAVENFILLPYGRGDLGAWSNEPWYGRNYFGGSLYISYNVYEDRWSPAGSLPANSTIEISLTPDGWLHDAREARSFTIRKQVGNAFFYINNIPTGKYRIEAKLSDGTLLNMKASALQQNSVFGMKPSTSTGPASLLFIPHSSEAHFGAPNLGGWKSVEITLRKP